MRTDFPAHTLRLSALALALLMTGCALTPTYRQPAVATPAAAQVLTPERVFESPDLSGPRARGVKLAPDGSAVTYLKVSPTDLNVTDLWIADVKGGAPRRLIEGAKLIPKGRTLSEAEKARRERAGVQTHGVVDYDWDERGRAILVPVEGDLWLYDRAAGAVTQLTDTAADEIDAKVSPKGGYVSFVRDDDLYVQPLGAGARGGGPERALCLYSADLIDALVREGHPVTPGALGENVTIRGLDWSTVLPGCELLLGDVHVAVTRFTVPCTKIRDAFSDKDFTRISAQLHPGWSRVYVRVLREGSLHVGDPVSLVRPSIAD